MTNRRQEKKRADLEMLSTLLNIAQQFGPEQKQRVALGAEGVREAQLRNQGLQAGLPFLGREHEARIGTVEDQRRYAGEMQPLQMQDIRGVIEARGLDNQFNRESMADRLGTVKSGAAQSLTAAKQGEQLRQPIVDRAQQELMQRGQAFPLELESQRIGNEYNRLGTQQRREEFPLTQTATALSNAGQLQQLGMMSKTQYNMPQFLGQQGMQLPDVAQSTDPRLSEGQLFADLLNKGFSHEEIMRFIMSKQRR